MVALRGPSGFVTSTLLNIIGDLLAGDGGEALIGALFLTRATQQRYLYRRSNRRFEGTVMALQRFLNLPDEEKERVLGIAKKQFAQYGYDQMSLNFFLRELDISKGQFYYWFEDKADLFFTIIKEGLDLLHERLIDHGMPTSKSVFWDHLGEERAIAEKLWQEKGLVEIGRMISQQITPLNPINQRLDEYVLPLKSRDLSVLELGRGWGIVRTDIGLNTLYELVESVQRAFYSVIGELYFQNPPELEDYETIQAMLDQTIRSLLEHKDRESGKGLENRH